MNLKNKKILVTGAGGFIGSHLTEQLIKTGAIVKVFLRYNSKADLGYLKEFDKSVLNNIEIIRGDLKNVDSVTRAIKNIDIIFHLGALISIPYSYIDPRDYVDTNIIGTLNILKAAQEHNVKKIIITSTSETYGTALYSPINEEHPLQAQSPYAATKISADKIAESFKKSFNLPIAIIKPFNTYGPRQSTRAVIPTIIYQALTGNKIRLGNLNPKRDFTFVKDTVDGFIKIAKSDNSIGETINIGFGETISIKELVKTIGKIMNKKLIIKIEKTKSRPDDSEVKLLLCDNSKAKKLIGWKPKTSLNEGLNKTIDYIKEHLEEYKFERENI